MKERQIQIISSGSDSSSGSVTEEEYTSSAPSEDLAVLVPTGSQRPSTAYIAKIQRLAEEHYNTVFRPEEFRESFEYVYDKHRFAKSPAKRESDLVRFIWIDLGGGISDTSDELDSNVSRSENASETDPEQDLEDLARSAREKEYKRAATIETSRAKLRNRNFIPEATPSIAKTDKYIDILKKRYDDVYEDLPYRVPKDRAIRTDESINALLKYKAKKAREQLRLKQRPRRPNAFIIEQAGSGSEDNEEEFESEEEDGILLPIEPLPIPGKRSVSKEARTRKFTDLKEFLNEGDLGPMRPGEIDVAVKSKGKRREAATKASLKIASGVDVEAFNTLLNEKQREAVQDCVQSRGRLLIAPPGFGKSYMMLASAGILLGRQTTDKVYLVVRKSTISQFKIDINRFLPQVNDSIEILTHELFGSERFTITGKRNAVLIDECQQYATSRFTSDGTPKQTMQAMNKCASFAQHVYLFSATPCTKSVEELKSLLYLVKGWRLKDAADIEVFNRFRFMSRKEGQRITNNWRCLVSYYQYDRQSDEYKTEFASVALVHREIRMSEPELLAYRRQEQRNPGPFGINLQRKCLTASKLDEMKRLLTMELGKFAGTNLKPRILVYVELIKQADNVFAMIKRELPESNPIRISAGEFDVGRGEMQPFVSDEGKSKVVVVTLAGVTGFDPPPLTAIISLNAFWAPSLRLQLQGRITRRNKHIQFDREGVEKVFPFYVLLSVKRAGESAELSPEEQTLLFDGDADDSVFMKTAFEGEKPYSYDTRQYTVSEDRLVLLEQAYTLLFSCSIQAQRLTCSPKDILQEGTKPLQLNYLPLSQ